MFCQSCGMEVASSYKFCPKCGGRQLGPNPVGGTVTGTPPQPPVSPVPTSVTAEITGITNVLRNLIYADILIAFLSMIATSVEMGSYGDPGPFFMAVMIISILVLVATFITFGMWIVRAHKNLQVLGVLNLAYTPGWSVGWFFVPFANLYKPYGAMKELWQASHAPSNWGSVVTPGLMPLWWGLWIVWNILGNISFRASMRFDSGHAGEVFGIITDAVGIPAYITALMVVTAIYRAQMQHDHTVWNSGR